MNDIVDPEGPSSPKKNSDEDAILDKLAEVGRESPELMFGLFSGPLPPPPILQAYDEIIPGSAKDLHDFAIKKVHQAIELDKLSLEASIGDRKAGHQFKVGQILTFVLSLTVILCGTVCVLQGHDGAGAAIVTGTLGSLVLAFLYGVRSKPPKPEAQNQKPPENESSS